MRWTRLLPVTIFLFLPIFAIGQSSPAGTSFTVSRETYNVVQQLIGDSILNGKAYEYDRQLADMIGPRLTGSSNYMRAAEWTEQQFRTLGLANVHTEEWTIPATWEPRVPATGKIVEPVEHQLHIYSAGWSPSTPVKGVAGEVIYVPSLLPDALNAEKAQLTGKIAFLDSSSYGLTPVPYKVLSGLEQLRSISPLAILTTGIANGGEAKGVHALNGRIASVPEAQIGLEDSLLIKRLLQHGPVTVQFSFANTIRNDVKIPNVIAEIPGSELSSEIVIVGAHLDSWQPGTGAQDNGTGVASVLETARAIIALNRAPRRTIRFVLFGGEEQADLGSTAYVREHIGDLPMIDAILVTDSGSEAAKGWNVAGREDEKSSLVAVKPLLVGLGADGVSSDSEEIFQTDHAAFDVLGVPSLILWTETDKYYSLLHTASDTFDSVVEKDLTQDATVTAVTTYAIADSKDHFASHLSPTEVRSMLEKAGSLEAYDYLKANGVLP